MRNTNIMGGEVSVVFIFGCAIFMVIFVPFSDFRREGGNCLYYRRSSQR